MAKPYPVPEHRDEQFNGIVVDMLNLAVRELERLALRYGAMPMNLSTYRLAIAIIHDATQQLANLETLVENVENAVQNKPEESA